MRSFTKGIAVGCSVVSSNSISF